MSEKVVIITGRQGVGKTTLAKMLAEKFKTQIFSSLDEIQTGLKLDTEAVIVDEAFGITKIKKLAAAEKIKVNPKYMQPFERDKPKILLTNNLYSAKDFKGDKNIHVISLKK